MVGSLYFSAGALTTPAREGRLTVGRIVYATAMSHVLYPDYYGKNVGPPGRRMVEELIAEVREMGRAMLAARPVAQSPFVSHPGRRQSVSP